MKIVILDGYTENPGDLSWGELEKLGDLTVYDRTSLTDEDGVVLALTAQDADDVADLVVTADDGVQLVLAGPLHQVGAIFLQGVIGLLRVVAGDPLVAPDGGQGLHHLFLGDVIGAEQLLQGAVGAVQQS